MNWHVTLYNVLTTVNNVLLILIGIPFILQFLYMFLFWLPKKVFPKSDVKKRICVVIPAHNEEDVIGTTVRRLFEQQQYPKDLFDVYVIAHNCTDRTAERARNAGATVFVLDDPDPKGTNRSSPRGSSMIFPSVWTRTTTSTMNFSP